MNVRAHFLSRALITLSLVIVSAHPTANRSLAADRVKQKQNDFHESVRPMLERLCFDCHGRKSTEGELNLTEFTSWKELENHPRLIEKMVEALSKHEMPLKGSTQPADDQREYMVTENTWSLN
jgi:uncharacterized membrane protein